MIVKLFVIMRFDIASRKQRFHMLQKLRVDCHHVFEMPVRRAIFDHPHLIITLNNLRLDLTDILIYKRRHFAVATKNLLTCLNHTIRA